jgi:UTP--glucose-1-phosphate uridylyltransferase
MSNKPIRKAIFPVAGLGTRFLPATKAIPKEMITVVDKPIIQHVVDEARAAGIEEFIFITGRNKNVIEEHFDQQYELETLLSERGKIDVLKELRAGLPQAGNVIFTRQQNPLGLGHAVWCARNIIGDEPFALLLPDMLPHGEKGCMSELMQIYQKTGGNLIGLKNVDPSETHKYGIASFDEDNSKNARAINDMVEKPAQGTAPSNSMIMGRYILQPEIFDLLEKQHADSSGEIQLTDAMRQLMKSQDFWGYEYQGDIYDCGSRLGFLNANIAFAMDDPELAKSVKKMLKRHVEKN